MIVTAAHKAAVTVLTSSRTGRGEERKCLLSTGAHAMVQNGTQV